MQRVYKMPITESQIANLKRQAEVTFRSQISLKTALNIIDQCTDLETCLRNVNELLPSGQGLIAASYALELKQWNNK